MYIPGSVHKIPTRSQSQFDDSTQDENRIRNDELCKQYTFERTSQKMLGNSGNDLLSTTEATSRDFVTTKGNSPILSNEEFSQGRLI